MTTANSIQPSISGSLGMPLLGHFPAYRRDRISFLQNQINEHGDLSYFRLGSKKIILVTHPDDVNWVMVKNAKNYHKATNLGVILGKGILTSEDDLWRKQRRTIAPLFHSEHIMSLVPTMNFQIQKMLQQLEQHPEVDQQMMELAYRVMGATLFGANLDPYFHELYQSMNFLNEFLTQKLFQLLPVPLSWPLPSHLRFVKAQKKLDQIVNVLIDQKTLEIESGIQNKDLISLLIQAKDPETGLKMDRLQVRDEVVTLLLAGHETTGHTLNWVLHYLAHETEIQEQIFSELRTTQNSELLSQVVDEVLRLRPPVWAFTRRALAADRLRGRHIEAGSILFMTPYFTHRHSDFWVDAEKFNPFRFSKTHATKTQSVDALKGAYFPFGLGPRQCVGKHFALLEVRLALAQILKRFKISPLDESTSLDSAIPEPRVTMGIRSGLKVKVIPRDLNHGDRS